MSALPERVGDEGDEGAEHRVGLVVGGEHASEAVDASEEAFDLVAALVELRVVLLEAEAALDDGAPQQEDVDPGVVPAGRAWRRRCGRVSALRFSELGTESLSLGFQPVTANRSTLSLIAEGFHRVSG